MAPLHARKLWHRCSRPGRIVGLSTRCHWLWALYPLIGLCLVAGGAILGCSLPCGGRGAARQTPPPILDSHIHIYDTTREQGVPWPPTEKTILYSPHLPADFREIAIPAGVKGAIVVEASPWFEDNQWVLDTIRGDRLFLGMVGNMDPGETDFAAQLTTLAQDPLFLGIRVGIFSQPNLLDESFLAGLMLLADEGKVLELPTRYDDAEIIALARAVPNLTIVMDHLIIKRIDGEPVTEACRRRILTFAERKNIFCKVSALYGKSAVKPPPLDPAYYQPALDLLLEAFGEDRLIFGSNWPVSDQHGDYQGMVDIAMNYFQAKGQAMVEKVFWRNARRIYGIDSQLD